MEFQHVPVLLKEAIEGLNIQQGGKYIDCNLGGGGHTTKILELGGNVLGLDVDQAAIEHCNHKFEAEIKRGQLKTLRINFRNLRRAIHEVGWKEQEIDGILYDLGVSTFQIKQSGRGFSFEDQSELDMRMDHELGVRAIDLLVVLSEDELASLISDYGEEPQAKVFARAIKKFIALKRGKVTASELAEVIKNSSKYRVSRNHPATRVFQALRIAVNSELSNFEESAEIAAEVLKPGGRIAIITFHSLEDRIAKNLNKRTDLKSLFDEPLVPTEVEVEENSPSRSAKLRVYEKIDVPKKP